MQKVWLGSNHMSPKNVVWVSKKWGFHFHLDSSCQWLIRNGDINQIRSNLNFSVDKIESIKYVILSCLVLCLWFRSKRILKYQAMNILVTQNTLIHSCSVSRISQNPLLWPWNMFSIVYFPIWNCSHILVEHEKWSRQPLSTFLYFSVIRYAIE